MLEGKVGRIIFSRIKTGEDLAEAIKERAEKSGVRAGLLIVIGGLKNAVLGYYKEGAHIHIHLDGPLEIASCVGNIAVDENGETIIHAHIIVTNGEGKAFGGHLLRGSLVGTTAELVMVEALGVDLKRSFDEASKLKLLNLE
ncbi:MAG: DNA-binding protein [Candidatus Bathyarchaeota archaeon]|nr:DNA-binding protein [Candidatus Bathyarchaeota archaeon]